MIGRLFPIFRKITTFVTSCLVSINKVPTKTSLSLKGNNLLPIFSPFRVNSFSGGRQNSFDRVTHQKQKVSVPLNAAQQMPEEQTFDSYIPSCKGWFLVLC